MFLKIIPQFVWSLLRNSLEKYKWTAKLSQNKQMIASSLVAHIWYEQWEISVIMALGYLFKWHLLFNSRSSIKMHGSRKYFLPIYLDLLVI